MKNLKNKKGFTLVELIVVIAILGILALFLVPSFKGYSEDAKNQVAQSNARTVWEAAKIAEAKAEYDKTIDTQAKLEEEAEKKLGSSFKPTDVVIGFKSSDEKDLNVTSVTYTTNNIACTYNGEEYSVSCGGTLANK